MELGAGQGDGVPPGEAPTGRGAHRLPVQQAAPGTGCTVVEHLVTLEGRERRETMISEKAIHQAQEGLPTKGSSLHNEKCSLSLRGTVPTYALASPATPLFLPLTSNKGLLWPHA